MRYFSDGTREENRILVYKGLHKPSLQMLRQVSIVSSVASMIGMVRFLKHIFCF